MLQQVNISYLAVLAAAIASMVVGFLWYGPLFGKMWIKLMNFDKKKMQEAKKKGMGKMHALAFFVSLVTAWVLAHSVIFASSYLKISGVFAGIFVGSMTWLGFFATTQLGMVMWEGKPVKLYLLNTLHYLVTLVIMASIIAVWPY